MLGVSTLPVNWMPLCCGYLNVMFEYDLLMSFIQLKTRLVICQHTMNFLERQGLGQVLCHPSGSWDRLSSGGTPTPGSCSTLECGKAWVLACPVGEGGNCPTMRSALKTGLSPGPATPGAHSLAWEAEGWLPPTVWLWMLCSR